ncbi:D-alanyl-lipoteichoic acid biosynthesis protein DltD [Enterococcus lactis]|nr:D-alanyl-lipoteichoic acid biosynthesis protein DltD [Enterococcus lactis]
MVVLIEKVTSADRYLARRLLTFSKVKENDTLTGILQTIKEGKLPLPDSLDQLHSQWNMLKREDEIFSDIGLKDRQQKIDHESKQLPDHYQETELSILADEIGKQETTNNPFGLKNDFYTHRIRSHEPELKQSQKIGIIVFHQNFLIFS